jgi:hypothetical protein
MIVLTYARCIENPLDRDWHFAALKNTRHLRPYLREDQICARVFAKFVLEIQSSIACSSLDFTNPFELPEYICRLIKKAEIFKVENDRRGIKPSMKQRAPQLTTVRDERIKDGRSAILVIHKVDIKLKPSIAFQRPTVSFQYGSCLRVYMSSPACQFRRRAAKRAGLSPQPRTMLPHYLSNDPLSGSQMLTCAYFTQICVTVIPKNCGQQI